MEKHDYSKRAFVRCGKKWSIQKAGGKVVMSLGVIDAEPLLDVLVVKQNNLYGLMNKNGEMVQPCQYAHISQPFYGYYDDRHPHEVLLLMTQDERYLLTDKNGQIITSQSYNQIGIADPSTDRRSCMTWNGMIELYDCDKNGHHGKSGLFDMIHVREVLPAIYEPGVPDICQLGGIHAKGIPVFDKSEGETRCKLIDAEGRDLIPFEEGFSFIGVPKDGDEYLIPAKRGGKWGYINRYGSVKIKFHYDCALDFTNGKAVIGFITDGIMKYGVIGHHDQLIVPPKYDSENEALQICQ